MPQKTARRALVVRGGWEGHSPVEATERFIPFLEDRGFVVDDHPIVSGLTRWTQETEQYWVLCDSLIDVLATSRHRATDDTPWRQDYVTPAVWTRQWGRGRVFASTIGHFPRDLDQPSVRTLTERGLLWASR